MMWKQRMRQCVANNRHCKVAKRLRMIFKALRVINGRV